MIHERRRTHRRAFAALAVAVPGLLLASLALRPEVPPLSPAERRLLREAGFAPGSAPVPAVETARGSFEIAVMEDGDGAPMLSIRPSAVILKPDLLVYWTSRPPGDALPPDAVLVGSLSGTSARRLALPARARGGNGAIVVYSVAHDEVVAHFAIREALAASAGT